jgi:hypothetical protein
MTAKPTATLQLEWCADKRLIVAHIEAMDEDGRPVTLKVIGEPVPGARLDTSECRLQHHAGTVAGHVELLVSACKYHLAEVSCDAARCARAEVRDAIDLLRAFEESLTRRIEGR